LASGRQVMEKHGVGLSQREPLPMSPSSKSSGAQQHMRDSVEALLTPTTDAGSDGTEKKLFAMSPQMPGVTVKVKGTFLEYECELAPCLARSQSAPTRSLRDVEDSDVEDSDVKDSAGSEAHQGGESTGLFLKPVPADLSLDDLIRDIHLVGFRVNFAHLPINRATGTIWGVAFVNLRSPNEAHRLSQHVQDRGLEHKGLHLPISAEVWSVQSLEECKAKYHCSCDVWWKDPVENRPACFYKGLRSTDWGHHREATDAERRQQERQRLRLRSLAQRAGTV